jgi:serine/threonine protein kinase
MSAGPPQDSTMEHSQGAVIGPYTVEALLGVGGMGRVYQAVDPHGERVALKVIKRELAQDTIFRRRFDREADIAVRVKHPHVVPVLDKGEHDGVPYLAQSFIRGGSLADKLERDGSLDVEYAVKICLWVAAGLDAVHAAGLVHRDVKPGNILLDEQGVAHITDFGLAKDSQASVLTRPGQALGSLDYMAPEQIRGEEVSAASDVYALGCVMIECLCTTPPFADRKGMQVLWAHLKDEPPDLCASRPDLSPEVSTAVRMALEKDPAKRPPTATAYARIVQIAARVGRGPQGPSGAD